MIATISFSPLALGYNYVNAMDEALNDVRNEKISEGVKYVKASTFEEAKKNFDEATAKLNNASSNKTATEIKSSDATQALDSAKTEDKASKENLNYTEQTANDLFKNISNIYEAKKNEALDKEKKAEDIYKQEAEALSELKDKLKIAKNEANEAKSKLDDVKSKYPDIEQYKEKKEKYDSLTKDIDALHEKIDKTTTDIANLENEVSNANDKVKQEKQNVEDKKADVEKAEKKLEDSKKELELAKTTEKNATNEDNEAKEQLLKAEKNLENATKTLDEAKAELEKNEKTKKDAEKELDALGNIDKLVKDMQDEIESAKADVANAQKKVDALKAELAPLESTKESAVADFTSAQNNLKAKEETVSAIDKEIDAKKADVQAAMDDWNKEIKASEDRKNSIENKTISDARDLYDELAADGFTIDQIIADAVQKKGSMQIPLKDRHGINQTMTIQEISEHASFKKAIKEATSKENVYRSIQLLEEFNEIRKAEGLPELKINGPLMVSSIVANAFSMFTLDNTFLQLWANHADNTSTPKGFQNLSWGLDKNADPYQDWYYKQKELVNQGVTAAKQIHNYKDIINNKASITGLSVTTAFGKYEGTQSYHQFITVTGKYEIERGRTFTTNEFKHLIDEYFKKPTAEYLAAQAEVDRLKANKPSAVLVAENALATIEADKVTAVQAVNEQKAVVNEKQDKVTKAQNKINAKNEEIEQAKKLVVDKQGIVNKKQEKLDKFIAENNVEQEKVRLNKQINELSVRIATLNASIPNLENEKTSALANLDTAKLNKQNKSAALETAKLNVQNKENNLNIARDKQADANSALADAKSKALEANKILEASNKKLEDKKQNKQSNQNALDAKMSERAAINLPMLPAGTYENYIAEKTNYNTKLNEEAELNKEVPIKEKAVDDAKTILDEAKVKLDNASVMLSKAMLANQNNPDTYADFEELVSAMRNKAAANTRRDKAINSLNLANNDFANANQALNDAIKEYNEALVAYNFAKSDYERFLAIEKEKQVEKTKSDSYATEQKRPVETSKNIFSVPVQKKDAEKPKEKSSVEKSDKKIQNKKTVKSAPAQKNKVHESDSENKSSDNNNLYGYGAAGLAGASAIAVIGMKRRKKNVK